MTCPSADEILDYLAARPDQAREAIEAHLADCAPCRVALSDLSRARFAEPERARTDEPLRPAAPGGGAIGRYAIGERLGSGAMGVVYAAHDPQLHRRVALKLLHRPGLAGSRAALLDEARTLARVSHPHVVTVFDAGIFDGRPFIVMEHVEGITLRRWLGQTRHSWRQILALFVAAGQGLAAAHAAGITHGDFKPDNVLVGADGRVRVTDFGLAGWAGAGSPAPSPAGGTPAYMAPEQLLGQRADARADQFSFCVALYEALVGRRPFEGPTVEALTRAVTAPRRPAPTREGRAPRWLLRTVWRGLSLAPDDRFGSMSALLSALESWRRRRRLAALAASGIALVGGVALFIHHEIPPVDRTCRIQTRTLGALWSAERRRSLRAALIAAGGGHADDRFHTIDVGLERYLRQWVTVRVGACEDAGATDAASQMRFRSRLACLDAQRAQVARLLERGAVPSGAAAAADAADSLAHALGALPPPETCMTAPDQLPPDR